MLSPLRGTLHPYMPRCVGFCGLLWGWLRGVSEWLVEITGESSAQRCMGGGEVPLAPPPGPGPQSYLDRPNMWNLRYACCSGSLGSLLQGFIKTSLRLTAAGAL